MALPSVTADKISSAMNHFDNELRTSAQWVNWEDNQSYRYAINKDGKLYPVKQIVSMATGANVNSFSGGRASCVRGITCIPFTTIIARTIVRVIGVRGGAVVLW
jgi:hypothetical protein